MKEAINYFYERYLSEKNAKELINNDLSNTKNKLTKIEGENEKLKEYVRNIEKRCEAVNNHLTVYGIEQQKFLMQIYKLKEQNNHLLYVQRSYVEIINNQKKDLSRLTILNEYYSSSKHDFRDEHRKYIINIVEKVLLLIKKLLVMGNQKIRRVKVICEIREQLAKYESCFYKNNFKLDVDARKILEKLGVYIEKWQNFYQGYRWNAKAVEAGDVKHIENLLQELHYVSLYKRFEKYSERIVSVETLYQVLKNKRKIQRNYSFKKFHNEMELLAKQKYINLEKFIINRIFPGEIYTMLRPFNQIEYNFKLLKTYGMYYFLYVYGSFENNTFKVGVTKQNLANRYLKAEESYNEHFSKGNFQEIKVIRNLNALNLESYLKKKFKQQRHPLFNSTEWFLLTKSELKYFLNEEYKQDADFMKILNYKLDV
ncbi:GIY-YIG nuclease family protein [Priestia aryabhattai]|uniref:GIY-YIG nuclease family protein n=1 Tax=Priestia aryabhattai TaxID=412384 RepID=UPI003D2CF349